MIYFLALILFSTASFLFTKKGFLQKKILNQNNLASTPNYYGYCSVIWFMIGAVLLIIALSKQNKLSIELFTLISLIFTVILNFSVQKYITFQFNARKHFEKSFLLILRVTSYISIAITFLIIISILVEAIRFFSEIPLSSFLFGTKWSPQSALEGSAGAGNFGAIPVFLGTLLITTIAIIIAVPFGIYSAIYLTEYASARFRAIAKPILEILAGVPTVVYGYFAAFTVAPFLRLVLAKLGISIEAESALAAGIVMGIMIIPFVLSLSDDVMNAVPESLKNASLGLGSTKSEMIKKVIIPAALPGIAGAILLAISRAIGETMIVTMAAGLNAKMSFNPLDSVTTATAQIVTLLIGDQEFDSNKTLAAFALGITLFVITLILNLIALIIVKKYREQYE
ncbi:MAG: phosphate ABC transporter permease subunit PstC [Alphaproteobacteria bacterium]|jgi:phosphate transport system permease protein|nr:phosphate ABC transporter permease subunit PstC [Alphaproteobacteria bacterium]